MLRTNKARKTFGWRAEGKASSGSGNTHASTRRRKRHIQRWRQEAPRGRRREESSQHTHTHTRRGKEGDFPQLWHNLEKRGRSPLYPPVGGGVGGRWEEEEEEEEVAAAVVEGGREERRRWADDIGVGWSEKGKRREEGAVGKRRGKDVPRRKGGVKGGRASLYAAEERYKKCG